MKIFLDIGHKYQGSISDKGILYKGVYEADLVEEYYRRLQEKIIQNGLDIITIKPDRNNLNCDYKHKIEWVNSNGIDLCISGHIKFNSSESDIMCLEGKKNLKIVGVLKDIINQDKYDSVGKVSEILKLDKNYEDYVPLGDFKCSAILFRPAFIDKSEGNKFVVDKFLEDVAEILFEFIIKK